MNNFKLSLTKIFLLIIATCLITNHCAYKMKYLSPESEIIHQNFWTTDSFLYDYLMKGTKYETPIFYFKGVNEGATVLILGGTHGNEPAGFEAAHSLLKQFSHVKLKSGEIFIIPEANKIANQKRTRRIPVPKDVDREKGNLNRCYPGDPNGFPMEKEAYEITQLMQEKGVDLLLDLHESPVFHLGMKDTTSEYHGLGQTLIYTPNDEGTWLGMVALDNINSSIQPGIKQFSLAERPIKYSAAWHAGTNFNIPGFTVETCKKLPLQERIQYQIKIVNIILKEKGIL